MVRDQTTTVESPIAKMVIAEIVRFSTVVPGSPQLMLRQVARGDGHRRRRFPHPHCSLRVGGRDYQVPIPNRIDWAPNAPLRKGLDCLPSPRMKGETAELSKLMQNQRENTPRMTGVTAELSKLMQIQREEKITPKEEVQRKKERGKRRLSRKENAKASAQNVVGDTAMVGSRPGGNLSRRVRKRRRPPKEKENEIQVLTKLRQLLSDKDLTLTMFAEMLDQFILDLAKHKVQKLPTQAAVETTAGKNAVEEAKLEAAAAGPKEDTDELEPQTVVAPQPEVKDAQEEFYMEAVVAPEPEVIAEGSYCWFTAEMREAKAREVFEKQSFEQRFLALEDQVKCATENLTSDFLCLRKGTEAAFEEAKAKARLDWNSLRKQRLDQTGGLKATATEVLERRLSALEDLIRTGRDQQLYDMDEGDKKIQRTVFKRLDVLENPQRERDARKAEHEAKQREHEVLTKKDIEKADPKAEEVKAAAEAEAKAAAEWLTTHFTRKFEKEKAAAKAEEVSHSRAVKRMERLCKPMYDRRQAAREKLEKIYMPWKGGDLS